MRRLAGVVVSVISLVACGDDGGTSDSPPTVTITNGPSDLTAATDASFDLTCSEASCTFECSLDGNAFASCATPASFSALADGLHSFAARATDNHDNVGPIAMVSWTIDTITPIVTITQKPAD